MMTVGERIELTIDGREVSAAKGTTILEICRLYDINIPTLCEDPSLSNLGMCRLCVVAVEGMKNLLPACVTQAVQGMVVQTRNARVMEARKVILELMLANHPQDCMTCQKTGNCKLADYAYEYGARGRFYEGEKRQVSLEDNNPFIVRDMEKCILCGKCISACDEIQGSHVLDFAHRGFSTMVGPAFGLSYKESECVFCGNCVAVCPTGALTEKGMVGKGRPWEVKKVRTTCPFCGTGCNFDLNIKDDQVIGVTSAPDAPVNQNALCLKGRFGMDMVHSPARITTPLIKREGQWVKAGWDEALDLVAERLGEIKKEYGPDAIGALSSARCTNEENYLMQKLMRAVIGSNNIDHCARTCHAPTVAGLAATLGSGAMTNSIEEIPEMDLLFVIGCNATEAHPVIGTKMKQAVRKGAKMIVADPRRIELAEIADLYLPIRHGTDVALINGLMHIILANGWEDKAFIAERTEQFEAFQTVVAKYPPEKVSQITGVPVGDLYKAAQMYAETEKAGIYYTLGITEHTCGTDNVMSLSNLAMLTGHLGRPFCGVNPLRGQNNVQGSCDMGALPGDYPGYQKVEDEESRRKFEAAWQVSLNPRKGLMIPEMLDQALEKNIRAMYVMGEDPVLSDADANHVRKAMGALDFLVVQNLYMTATAEYADVILPGASFAEKEGTFTNCERRVQKVNQGIDPVGNCRPDWEIFCDLAGKMGYHFPYESPADIMEEIAALTPQYGGISYENLGRKGLQWPVPHMGHPGTPILHVGRFTRGRGLFMPVEYEPPNEMPDEEFPFILSTGRKLEHYNITTRHSAALEAHAPEEEAELNPSDGKRLGVKSGERIKVISRRGELETKVKLSERVPEGTLFMTLHYWETPTNVLTNPASDKVTQTYEYKVCAVNVSRLK